SSIGIVGIFSGILWGTVSDYIGRKYALAVVFAIHAVCYFLFATAHSTGVLYVSAILFGFSAFSIPGIVAATCGDYVGPNLAPAALGMVTLFFAVGQASAPSVAGYLADATDSMTVSFLLAAAVAVLGSTGSLTLRQGVVPTDGGVCQKAYHSGS
ncbi:MAG: YbfB/YjiJ family MFS transporter, partial [Eubacteriales bacterium]|nr:YbfB/YjiJ family MFS transporter [Eubacteriales bacterium]